MFSEITVETNDAATLATNPPEVPFKVYYPSKEWTLFEIGGPAVMFSGACRGDKLVKLSALNENGSPSPEHQQDAARELFENNGFCSQAMKVLSPLSKIVNPIAF